MALRLLLTIYLLFSAGLAAQEYGFVPNRGQWSGDFDLRLERAQSYLFLRANEQRVLLQAPKLAHDHIHEVAEKTKALPSHAYRLLWLGAKKEAEISYQNLPQAPRINYLLGNDPDAWASNLPQYEEVIYKDVYPNIDLRYYINASGACQYDLIVHPGGDPSQIRWRIDGADRTGLIGEDLAVLTSVQNAIYSKPLAYQNEKQVSCAFQVEGDNTFSFNLGDYNKDQTLVIDPILVFSTYSGSTDDNFGLSATYGEGDMAYGAGVNFFTTKRQGFPTTLGAFQDSSIGSVDVSIAKYTADGTAQIYATYLGGTKVDVPFSLLEGPNKSLIILGTTESPDFPMLPNGYDTSFAYGPGGFHRVASGFQLDYSSDMFLSVLDSTGGSLLGSTYLGDSMKDAVNNRMEFNYGDGGRGDIALDQNNNILISSFTESEGLPSASSGTNYGGLQDGLVASFSPSLDQLNWLTYVGGESNDAVFSLRYTNADRLFITGATESDSISTDTIGVYQPFRAGKVDAFVAELNPVNGQILKFTYSGTAEHDIAYFIDFDPQGEPVIFGQTFSGNWPIVGDSIWGVPGSAQFLQELSTDLGRIKHSTTFGNGVAGITNISPTALLVSDCGDIFLSGWGATYPSARGIMGRARGLPLSPDAYRDTADLGDFYLMRLDASWQRLEYGTFFGQLGFGPDHVDGGSSRFRKDGSIFQAVCSCGSNNQGFPTTPNAFADTKGSNNCNMAVFRFDMEADVVRADVRLASGISDSLCLPDSVSFEDFSFNADLVFFRTEDGVFDTLDQRFFTILDSGYTNFTFIAQDTSCGLVDSTVISVYAFNEEAKADFEVEYDSCDASGLVKLRNLSSGATRFRWNFGNGDTSALRDPQINLAPNTYQIELIAIDPYCNQADTLQKTIEVQEINDLSAFSADWDACDESRKASFKLVSFGFQEFNWQVDGNAINQNSDTLSLIFDEGGFHTVSLRIEDTICQRTKSFEQELFFYDEDFSVDFPNVFSPNGDDLNERFQVLEPEKLDPILGLAQIEIYNRHGLLLYQGDFIRESWDGTHLGEELPEGVYFYLFNFEDICGNKSSQKGFVHLER